MERGAERCGTKLGSRKRATRSTSLLRRGRISVTKVKRGKMRSERRNRRARELKRRI
jgi:hypothetical protein